MASAEEKREDRLEAGRCWRALRLPRKERECLRDLETLKGRWVEGGNGILSYSACLFLELKSVPGVQTGRTGSLGVTQRAAAEERKAHAGVM